MIFVQTPLLKIENLRKSYRAPDGEQVEIVNVSHFIVQPAEQIALAGASGSGKTTLLNLIAGITTADAGSIELDNVELTELSEARRDRLRAKTIGYVFQTFNLLQGYTAIENVLLGMRFGAGANKQRALELLARVGLKTRADYRPRQLSAGQQQRVAVARALANRPKLILADEPTGNLDAARAAEALHLIREICREQSAALLLVSHDAAVLQRFERVENLSVINRV